MIDAKFVGEIIEYLLKQKIDRQEFLDVDGRLKKEGISNLLLAANCLAEVRNRIAIAPIATRLLQVLKKEVEAEYPHRFNEEAATAILMAIAQNWKDDPEILPWLKSCLQFGYTSVSWCAVRAIAQNWKDHPDTLILLKDWAQNDGDFRVRRGALEELARGGKDDSEILILLKDRAQNDADSDVRRVAVQELARGWKDTPGMFDLLQDRAVNDPFTSDNEYQTNPRKTALEAIVRYYHDHPQTLDLLRDRADNDPDEQVRNFAQNLLERRKRAE